MYIYYTILQMQKKIFTGINSNVASIFSPYCCLLLIIYSLIKNHFPLENMVKITFFNFFIRRTQDQTFFFFLKCFHRKATLLSIKTRKCTNFRLSCRLQSQVKSGFQTESFYINCMSGSERGMRHRLFSALKEKKPPVN